MESPVDLAVVLAKLRARYAASAGDMIAQFTLLAERLERAPSDSTIVREVRDALHRIHGTAGSLGFHDASRLAGALELVADGWVAAADLDLLGRAELVRQFARDLTTALSAPPGGSA